MKKEHVIIVLVLAAVVAATGGVYQFYFKPRLEVYAQDRDLANTLETKVEELGNTFSHFQPEVIGAAWRGEIQPWTDALFARAAFFNMEGMFDIDPIPDAMMLKFYYKEQSKKMLDQLHEKIRLHTPYCYYPNVSRFGAPGDDEYQTMNKAQVSKALSIIKFGCSTVEMLLKAKATEISRVEIWPRRFEYGGLLNMRTTGLAFKMTMENLVTFVEKDLRTADRYFNIDAISIQNRYLRPPQPPQLDIQMLLTQAVFDTQSAMRPPGQEPGEEGKTDGTGATAVPSLEAFMKARMEGGALGFGSRGRRDRDGGGQPQERTKFQKFVRWMDKHFWPFN